MQPTDNLHPGDNEQAWSDSRRPAGCSPPQVAAQAQQEPFNDPRLPGHARARRSRLTELVVHWLFIYQSNKLTNPMEEGGPEFGAKQDPEKVLRLLSTTTGWQLLLSEEDSFFSGSIRPVGPRITFASTFSYGYMWLRMKCSFMHYYYYFLSTQQRKCNH